MGRSAQGGDVGALPHGVMASVDAKVTTAVRRSPRFLLPLVLRGQDVAHLREARQRRCGATPPLMWLHASNRASPLEQQVKKRTARPTWSNLALHVPRGYLSRADGCLRPGG